MGTEGLPAANDSGFVLLHQTNGLDDVDDQHDGVPARQLQLWSPRRAVRTWRHSVLPGRDFAGRRVRWAAGPSTDSAEVGASSVEILRRACAGCARDAQPAQAGRGEGRGGVRVTCLEVNQASSAVGSVAIASPGCTKTAAPDVPGYLAFSPAIAIVMSMSLPNVSLK